MRGLASIGDIVSKLGSSQLQAIVANLADESAVTEGRTIVDYKLFDSKVLNVGGYDNSGTYTSKTGNITLKGAFDFFNKKWDKDILNVNYLNPTNATNVVQGGITEEPYRWDRLAIDLFVFDCTASTGTLTTANGQSLAAARVFNEILSSGRLTVKCNNKDLNYVSPLAFGGASQVIVNTNLAGVYNRKTPKYIDPAIFMPENTTFGAKVEFDELIIPACMTVVMTVSLIGYKFFKNS